MKLFSKKGIVQPRYVRIRRIRKLGKIETIETVEKVTFPLESAYKSTTTQVSNGDPLTATIVRTLVIHLAESELKEAIIEWFYRHGRASVPLITDGVWGAYLVDSMEGGVVNLTQVE